MKGAEDGSGCVINLFSPLFRRVYDLFVLTFVA